LTICDEGVYEYCKKNEILEIGVLKKILLCAENITKSYLSGNAVLEVLNGVNFQIWDREMAVLLGSSGSGKSTLLNILAGIDKPDTGQIFMEEEDITLFTDDQMADKRNREIGFVLQFHHLLGDFTVLENVMMPALIAGTDKGLARKKTLGLLEDVGLAERADHKPGELSGGEAQRVAVARALINDPKLVLADEPTGNLDRANGHKLIGLLTELNEKHGTAFLVATHNMELLNDARRLLLIDGKISEG